MSYALCYGNCYGCKQPMFFNPMRVPSIRIDDEREPICRSCIERANPARVANGLAPIEPHPDAYEVCPESDLSYD